MGLFDYVHYQGKEYQSKDTPNQATDNFKIEHDQESGHEFLWLEEYDSEWVDEHDTFLGGYIKKFNERWIRCDEFDGLIKIYRQKEDKSGWITYKFLFMNGQMIKKQYFED
jgi:hypothetical protein